MTWIWVKKRRGIITTTFVLFTFILTSLPNGTKAEEGAKPEEGTGGGNGTDGGGNGTTTGDNGVHPVIIMNSTDNNEMYSDVSDFKTGINGWDFTGTFAKIDLATLTDEERPIPLVPEGEHQTVMIVQIRMNSCRNIEQYLDLATLPSTLKKTYPPLHNGTISINYIAKGEVAMTIEVVGSNTSEIIFNYTQHDGVGKEHTDGEWGTDTIPFPHLASEGDFEIILSVNQSEAVVWAASRIEVKGVGGSPSPTTTPAPSNNVTNVTTVAPGQNVTLTTLAPEGNGTVIPVTEGTGDEDMSRLESVAKAVWDAFYVFLALFCACLLALVALIIHGRCKYVGSYPLHRETA